MNGHGTCIYLHSIHTPHTHLPVLALRRQQQILAGGHADDPVGWVLSKRQGLHAGWSPVPVARAGEELLDERRQRLRVVEVAVALYALCVVCA